MPFSFLPYSGLAIISMVIILSIAELVKYVKNQQHKHNS
jgi:hypothetical protein